MKLRPKGKRKDAGEYAAQEVDDRHDKGVDQGACVEGDSFIVENRRVNEQFEREERFTEWRNTPGNKPG